MKIRHTALPYVIPAILVFSCLLGVITDASRRGAVLIIVLLIVAVCATHYFSASLSVDENMVRGRTGIIKIKTLTSPLNKIQYCEYTKVLFFNKIKVSALTGIYEFSNMSHAKEFVDYLNEKIEK